MDGQHLHVEFHGGLDGLGDGVGYVMELEVEEHGGPGGTDAADDVRPGADEQFLADLEGADGRRDLPGKLEGGFGIGNLRATMIGFRIAAMTP